MSLSILCPIFCMVNWEMGFPWGLRPPLWLKSLSPKKPKNNKKEFNSYDATRRLPSQAHCGDNNVIELSTNTNPSSSSSRLSLLQDNFGWKNNFDVCNDHFEIDFDDCGQNYFQDIFSFYDRTDENNMKKQENNVKN